jgi:hypothetical protein
VRFWTPVEVTSSGHLDALQHKPTDAVVAPEPASAKHRASDHLAAQLKTHHSGPPTAIRVPSSHCSATGNPFSVQQVPSARSRSARSQWYQAGNGRGCVASGFPTTRPPHRQPRLHPLSPYMELWDLLTQNPGCIVRPNRVGVGTRQGPPTGSAALVTPSQHVTPRPPQSEPGVTQTLRPGAATAPI